MNPVLFSSAKQDWTTPRWLFAQLDYWPLSRGARVENSKAHRWHIPVAHWQVWVREARQRLVAL